MAYFESYSSYFHMNGSRIALQKLKLPSAIKKIQQFLFDKIIKILFLEPFVIAKI